MKVLLPPPQALQLLSLCVHQKMREIEENISCIIANVCVVAKRAKRTPKTKMLIHEKKCVGFGFSFVRYCVRKESSNGK